jgi:bacterioferritin (cytochrome b1)
MRRRSSSESFSLDGRPRMEQPSGVTVGATVPEQLRSALETEGIEAPSEGRRHRPGRGRSGSAGIPGRSASRRGGAPYWFETQLSLIDSIGEANSLAQQLHA